MLRITTAGSQRVFIRVRRIISSDVQHAGSNAVLIRDGIIEDIVYTDLVPSDVRVYDFSGLVMTPLLCDYHLHFSASARNSFASIEEKLLAHGIGKAYDGGDAAATGLIAKKALSGDITVLSAGRGIYKAGAYGKYIGVGVRGVEDALRVIDALRSDGIDYIKIVHSGIYDAETDRITSGGFARKELREMISYAQDNGLAVYCHANGARAVQEAVEEGAYAIIHGLGVSDATLSEMHDRKVIFIPTLQAFRSIGRLPGTAAAKNNIERTVDGHLTAVSKAYEKGVTVHPGSDAGPQFIPYGTSFVEELGLMMRAGIPYDHVIRNACSSHLEPLVPAALLLLEGLAIKGMFLQGKFLPSFQHETA